MIKMVTAILPLVLILSLIGCNVKQPTPKEQTTSNETAPSKTTPDDTRPKTENAMPKLDALTVPPVESKASPTKPAELTQFEKMKRNLDAGKELQKQLGLKNVRGQQSVRVSLSNEGEYTGITIIESPISDEIVTFISKSTPQLKELSFTYCPITDEQLSKLSNLKSLESFDLQGTPISGTGLSMLEGFDKLKDLDLSSCVNLTLKDLPSLPSLTELSLVGSLKISDADIPKLGSLKSLKKLGLFDTGITAEGLTKLKKMLPDCKIGK